MNESPLFAGYATLEGWAQVVDPTRPVYATRLVEPGASYEGGGPVVYDLCVLVSQPDEQGILHYCRIKAATLTMLHGEPFDSNAEWRQQCHADLWQLVQEWLSEQGFTVRQAALTMPQGLKYFEGRAGFVAWDKEAKRYYRTDKTP